MIKEIIRRWNNKQRVFVVIVSLLFRYVVVAAVAVAAAYLHIFSGWEGSCVFVS